MKRKQDKKKKNNDNTALNENEIKTNEKNKDNQERELKNNQKPKNKAVNTNLFRDALLGASIIILLTTGILFYSVKNDLNTEFPSSFVKNQTAQQYETNYFSVVLNRIPISAMTYDPENNDMNYSLGFDVSSERLNYGIMPINSPSAKTVKMANDYGAPAKVKARSHGNISNYISLGENNFILNANQKKEIYVRFDGAESNGTYDGELEVRIIIPHILQQNDNFISSKIGSIMLAFA